MKMHPSRIYYPEGVPGCCVLTRPTLTNPGCVCPFLERQATTLEGDPTMKTTYALLLGTALTGSLLLAGCADPAENTPDAVVTDVPAEEAPAAEPMAEEAPAEAAPAESTPAEAAPEMEAKTYTISPDSAIGFIGSKVTGAHEGGFKQFAGTVTLPGEDLTQAAIDVTIDMNSTYSDNDKLTGHLLSADFFEVEKFPESTFKSTAIVKDGEGYKVTGNFTFHGVTKSITFPASLSLADGTLSAMAEFDINRFDFGVEYPGKADDLIRENVVIKLDIKATA